MHRKEKVLFILTFLILLVCFGAFIFFRMQKPKAVEADLDALGKTLAEQNLTTSTVPGTVLELKRRFGLLSEAYPDILYFAPESFMNVEEILVVRTPDASSGDNAEALIQKSVEGWTALFENYGTNQYGFLKDSILYRNEYYVCYAAGENAQAIINEIRAWIER